MDVVGQSESRGKHEQVDLSGVAQAAATERVAVVPSGLNWDSFIEQRHYLINGEMRTWVGAMQEVPSALAAADVGPRLLGAYPNLTRVEAVQALDAALTAFDGGLGVWPSMSAAERIACVEKLMVRLSEQKSEIVKRIVWEVGKSLPDATREFERTVEYVKESCVALRKIDAVSHKSQNIQGTDAAVIRTARGVTLCMGPFNYPLNETFTTLIPALLMGNTVVMKPPKLGVLLFEPVMEAFQESFPPGVVNTVYGDGQEVIGPIMESGKVDILAFIGSSQVAGILLKQHPQPQRLVSVLGLGSKNPAIVLKDADLESSVHEAIAGALTFNGQRCTALARIYVHSSIAEEFAERMAKAADSLRGGLPWEPGVKLTPCAEPGKAARMNGLVEDAVSRGARLMNPGGGQVEQGVYRPAVLYPVDKSMRIFNEEQFGPVVPIVPYDDLSEVLGDLRSSSFGQQASIFGEEGEEMRKLTAALSHLVCRVNINTQCQRGPDVLPFTGRKDSAMGTLSIVDALELFSLPCVVARKAAA